MDLQDIIDLMKSAASDDPEVFDADHAANKVNSITKKAAAFAGINAEKGKSAAPTAAVTMQCTVAAVKVLFGIFIDGMGSLQERLLFSLLLTGACSTFTEDRDGERLQIEISPDNFKAATQLYEKIMGKDITSYLAPSAQKFIAEVEALN